MLGAPRGFGTGRTRRNLASIFAAANGSAELVVNDPFEAAEHLFGLWQGFSNLQLSLGVETAIIRAMVERLIDGALDALRINNLPSANRGSNVCFIASI